MFRSASQQILGSNALLNQKTPHAIDPKTGLSHLRKSPKPLYLSDKITASDMVAITMGKGQAFGIEGYNLPKKEFKLDPGIQWKVGKQQRKNFADVAAALTGKYPGPGEYPGVKIKWGCADKKVKPGEKVTFISQIFKDQKKYNNPASNTVRNLFYFIIFSIRPA